MRRSVTKTLLQGQNVCFFCALRYSIGASSWTAERHQQLRAYKSSASVFRPAGAAAARVEEEDEDEVEYSLKNHVQSSRSPQSFLQRSHLPRQGDKYSLDQKPDWKCQCGFSNLSSKTECAGCRLPRRNAFKPFSTSPNTSNESTPNSPGISPEVNFGQRYNGGRQREERGGYRHPEITNGRDSRYRSDQDVSNGRIVSNDFLAAADQTTERNDYRPVHQPDRRYGSRSSSFPDQGRRTPTSQSDKSQGSFFRRVNLSADNQQGSDESRTPLHRQQYGRDKLHSGKIQNKDQDQSTSGSNGLVLDNGFGTRIEEDIQNAGDRSRRPKISDVRAERRNQRFEADPEGPVSEAVVPSANNQKNPNQRYKKRSMSPEFDPDAAENSFYENTVRRGKQKSKRATQSPMVEIIKPRLQVPEFISVEKLAKSMKVKVEEFMAKLEEEGFEGARHDHILDFSTSAIFADLYGFELITGGSEQSRDLVARPPAPDPSILPPRPPIVTIMGHVDHGKTTILDWLRKSSVVDSEHGGITQHIGAFSVTMPGTKRQITFLDTPGHAAFLDMRRRGANVTDIVVLVVAADDSVKPQTIEAIKHALEAKVHIIVAINKVDKEEANVDRVKQDLSRHDITVEDYGGEYQAIAVSGKTGKGMEDLEEAILTLADVSDFRAETDCLAEGWVIESKVTTSGRVATVLVRRGILRPGDSIVAGTTWARVRTLRNDAGQIVSEALPGTPVQIDGWRGDDPTAGLEVLQAENEEQAKTVIRIRQGKVDNVRATSDTTAINVSRAEEAEARAKVLAWEAEQGLNKRRRRRATGSEGWVEKEAADGPKEVHFVIKADVAGSVEALVAAIEATGNKEVTANIIHSGTGILTESDIRHLATTGEVGYAISFNQPVEKQIHRLAEAANLSILDHNIIYKVTDEVKEKLSAELPPLITQRVLGEAEIGQIFEISTKKKPIKIAGCKITNGIISRSEKVRVVRKGEVIFTGMLDSLKNVKKDVTEMRKGTECGMGFENWEGFQEGDQIQSFEEISQKRTMYQ